MNGRLLLRHAGRAKVIVIVCSGKDILIFNQEILADQRADSNKRTQDGEQQNIAAGVADLQAETRCIVLQTLCQP